MFVYNVSIVFNLQYRQIALELDAGRFPEGMEKILSDVGAMKQE